MYSRPTSRSCVKKSTALPATAREARDKAVTGKADSVRVIMMTSAVSVVLAATAPSGAFMANTGRQAPEAQKMKKTST